MAAPAFDLQRSKNIRHDFRLFLIQRWMSIKIGFIMYKA